MNDVFKHFNVCDDVADMICHNLHQSYQKEINNHISVIVNWNENFDYWKLHNLRIPLEQLAMIDNIGGPHPDSRFIYTTFRTYWRYMGEMYQACESRTGDNLITNEEYMKYVFSNKKIFGINSIHRKHIIYQYMLELINKKALKVETTLSNSADGELLLRLYETEQTRIKKMMNDPCTIFELETNLEYLRLKKSFDPIMQSINTYTKYGKLSTNYYPEKFPLITKKVLARFLNKNGVNGKFTHKKKIEIWKMIYNL